MLSLKHGVSLKGLQPQMVLAAEIVYGAYRDSGTPDCVITAGSDGQHMQGSLHYKGCALDFRTHGLREVGVDPRALTVKIREALGPNFDVLLEHPLAPEEHIHVEWQEKA